jgi:uncharacterized protein (DUF952 family)
MAGCVPVGMLQRSTHQVKAYARGCCVNTPDRGIKDKARDKRPTPLDADPPPGQTDAMALIYKIFRASEYAAFVQDGSTAGAPIDLADGYIHISTAEQVGETAARHFAGEERLKLLALQAEALGEALRWEPSRGGALFPHLYRNLRAEDVLWARDLPLQDGVHSFNGLIP